MSIFAAPAFYNQADQNIYNQGFSFIPQERFRGGAFNFPTSATTTGTATGINTVPINMGGGGGGSSGNLSINELLKNYTLDTRDQYFGSQPTPLVDDLYQSKLDKTFMGFPSYRQQELTGADLGEYIGSDTDIPLEQTTAGKIQSGLGNIKDKASGIMSNIKGFGPISMVLGAMDRFSSLSPADQEFIKQNMGYTGPTVFGENTTGLSKDPFGLNTRSAFGNYAERVGKEANKLGDLLTETQTEKYGKGTSGISFNASTGMFEAIDPDDPLAVDAALRATQMNKMNIAKYNFYTQKEKERIANEKLMAEQAAAASRAESARQYDPNIHGPNNYGLDSSGKQSFDSGMGFGIGSDGGPVSNRTGRGRTGFMMGGLTDLVDIYD
jgi:hypothetical protein